MKLKQLSVFVENKPGSVGRPCKALADAGINITTLTLADTKDFGILRFIIDDWQKAYDVLKEKNFAVSVNDVIALEVSDVPGGLSTVLEKLEERGLNVEYMYASVYGSNNRAVLVFRFDDTDSALEKLDGCPELKIVSSARFFSLK